MSRKMRSRLVRRTSIESLEARQLMAVDPLDGLMGIAIAQHGELDGSTVATTEIELPALEMHDELEQNLNSAHTVTGMDTVRANYGFSGTGQTVVVIDTGIAYDHYALGGGLGANYRVVGGWDFTEGDADPYDDGPEGFHGTHVAGIIGSTGDTSGNNEGVAPGVDLVGLRVFDDTGYGHFGYVSSALQWVIDNHDSFANPITAINLSLGTAWNSDSPPAGYSYIESKFQQIEALGIFISVSAGNSYTSYNTAGLSYPAASPYVVPVMSADDSGSLSYFSQRHSSAIAAPGRFIRSTIPDYIGNNNSVADDWGSASGTSMAAPYVAGASVILRQAMELVGYTNVTQDVIYDHMRDTAVSFYDSATSQSYLRLDMAAAIDALMPDDDYGNSESAHDLGTLGAGETQVSGMISSLADGDYFTFTASTTGMATFSATASHEMDVAWDFGAHSATQDGDNWTMDVVAGQTYTVGLSTSDGLGYYDMDVSIESTFSFVDWGSVNGQQSHTDMGNTGETWYRVVAGQAGYVTAEAMFANASGDVDIAMYDANMGMLDQSATTADSERVEYLASAGEEFFIRVTGTNADIDFQLTNLVNLNGSTLNIDGTSGDDAFSFVAGTTHELTVNGVDYSFAAGTVTAVVFSGGAGSDTAEIYGTADVEQTTIRVGQADVVGVNYSVQVLSAETLLVESGGGYDQVVFYDSAADEYYVGRSDRATFGGTGYRYDVVGYSNSLVFSDGGTDRGTFYDTAGDEWYLGMATRVRFGGAGFHHDLRNFESTLAYSSGGNDSSTLYDTDADDVYVAMANRAIMAGDGYHNDTRGFYRSLAYATGGYDFATFYDTAGDDNYVTWSDRAILAGAGYYNDSRGFERTRAFSTTGNDTATFYDTAGDDNYIGRADQATMMSSTYRHDAYGFGNYVGTATSGYDSATLYDSAGNDTYIGYHNRAKMWGDGYNHSVTSFDRTVTFASTGYDQATFYDSAGDDVYVAWTNRAIMTGTGFYNDTHGFDRTTAFSSAGNDSARFYDSAGNETYTAWSNRALMSGSGFVNDARGFASTKAYSTGGYDRAVLYDSAGDDDVQALAWGAYMTDGVYLNQAEGFDRVDAYRNLTGDDEATVGSIDYLFNLIGDWSTA